MFLNWYSCRIAGVSIIALTLIASGCLLLIRSMPTASAAFTQEEDSNANNNNNIISSTTAGSITMTKQVF